MSLSHHRVRFLLTAVVTLLCCGSLLAQQPFPKLHEESLAGRPVILPDDALGKTCVLIFGFSRESRNPTTDWSKRIQADYVPRGIFLYQLPLLEEVPGLIRGMIISNIKKGVPENQRPWFVPVLHNEAQLKQLVQYKQPDDAYLVVLDPQGRIAFQMHGMFSDDLYAQFRHRLEGVSQPAP